MNLADASYRLDWCADDCGFVSLRPGPDVPEIEEGLDFLALDVSRMTTAADEGYGPVRKKLIDGHLLAVLERIDWILSLTGEQFAEVRHDAYWRRKIGDPKRPFVICPYCGRDCSDTYETVDIGVGEAQCSPCYCRTCGAVQMGPYDPDDGLTDREKAHRWHEPGRPAPPTANTIDGVVVDIDTARRAYEMGILDDKPRQAPVANEGDDP